MGGWYWAIDPVSDGPGTGRRSMSLVHQAFTRLGLGGLDHRNRCCHPQPKMPVSPPAVTRQRYHDHPCPTRCAALTLLSTV